MSELSGPQPEGSHPTKNAGPQFEADRDEAIYKALRDLRDSYVTNPSYDGGDAYNAIDAIMREFWPGTVTG